MAPRVLAAGAVFVFSAAACEKQPSESNSPGPPAPPSIACESRPGELPRPPEGRLPCELLPPGFEQTNAGD
ncbi:MAG TPA: hypothetical protein VF103_10420 [Polyangiaceae bacterium]